MYTVRVSGIDPFHIYLGASGLATNMVVTLSKNGGAFNTVSPSINDRNNGYYEIEPIAAHRNTLGENAWLFSPSGSSAMPRVEQVVNYDFANVHDAILSRSVSFSEANAAEHSLATLILLGTESFAEGAVLTIKRSDGTTTYLTKTLLLVDPSNANSIKGIQ
jgi:hypothetical protein